MDTQDAPQMIKRKKPKCGGWAYKRKPEAEIARRAAETRRILAADDYLTGRRTLEDISRVYGVAISTARDWVSQRRKAITPRREPKPKRDITMIEVTHGTGGKMTDREVRQSTKALGAAIVALQAKLGLDTFDYAGRILP